MYRLIFCVGSLICESIARRIFPCNPDPEYKEIKKEAHYAYRFSDRLRKQVLVPLREALKISESFKKTNLFERFIQDRILSSTVELVRLL